ncbi:Uridine 5'-monophosphate synthase [Trichinella murrelli]|uniref:orotate phosphoribosyltransferase n=1 Tax=Trichinella murrelli TaxID=144512 RepID=A0A0V0TDC7_9BILA|nr:Uridine 5'-monophosphate synthase [Trichinella murrelli]
MGATGLGEHRITVHLSSCHLLFTTTLLKMDARYETFLTDLFHLGAIQFGEFMLKSKHTSPIYVDMRRLLSHPTLLNTVEDLMYDYAKELEYDVICGVPYGAIPLTSALSVKRSIPMIMQRKDAKAYGTKKIVEGLYKPGDKCLIIEDVITFGSSIAETARVLRAQGLIVTDALVILDRCQGASRNLENLGITKWSLFCLPDVLLLYEGRGLISNADCQRISSYLFNVTDKIAPSALGNGLQEGAKVDKTGVLSVKAASNTASLSHNLAKHLWQIALDKKSNLCVACKSSDPKEIIALAQKIGKFICMLIIRSDLICKVPLVDFISELKTCAKSKNFMIMDDRKFCDVSSIVEMQLTGGEWSIAKWVDFVTVLPFSGRGVFSAIRKVSAENKVACFSILSLHAKDSLIPKEFSEQSMKTAEKDIDVIAGVVCSKPPVLDSRFLYMTSADESDQALLRFEDFDEMQFLEVEYLEMNHGIQYADIYKLVEAVAVNICSLKLHADLIAIKEMPDFFSRLKRLAQSKKFMLINDGNYCDDSDVVVELMLNSATKPASWADFVTVQCLNGSSVFEAIKRVNSDYSVACLPVVEMSTSGNFFTEEYKKRALSLAQQYRQIVAGFICQKRPINDPSFLYISPGVHYKRRLDDQNWRTPDKAVRFNRDDIVVVGRGITKEKYSRVWAYTYQQISWDAFIIMNNAAANVE